jgi:hypothetical protein
MERKGMVAKYYEGISPQTIERFKREEKLCEDFLLVVECDFCGMVEGEHYFSKMGQEIIVFILRNHYEEHLDGPRAVNICWSCHQILHSIERVQINEERRKCTDSVH